MRNNAAQSQFLKSPGDGLSSAVMGRGEASRRHRIDGEAES
jgi:hypothetical protein